MRQSARQLEEASGFGALLREGLILSAAAALRNPLAVGGATAFVVAFGFISANALWYQPHFHDGAFFSTRAQASAVERAPAEPQAVLRDIAPVPQLLERAPEPQIVTDAESTSPVLPGDPTVARVQTILKGLDLYDGDVDGLSGPQTSAAVTSYQRIVGLKQTGAIDDGLLTQLGISPAGHRESDPVQVAGIPSPIDIPDNLPVPAPRPRQDAAETAAFQPDARIVRIQAGLRAFGNDGIDLDGKVGARTRRAIEEFQSLFGLPVTGEPDDAVFAKMREIGLTD